MMKIDFSNRTALVTGGTRGIGASIAQALKSCGAEVYITGTDPNFISDQFNYLFADFSDVKQVIDLCEKLSELKVDVLVNNAGINKIDTFDEISLEDWNTIQQVNVNAPFAICKTLAPMMAKNNYGRIVNISSIFGNITKEKRASYTASKFALAGMTKALAVDYAQQGVLCNCVAPGFIDTELTRSILNAMQIESLTSLVPMKRLGTTKEIANVVAFLASELNTFITAQTIIVDGGFTNV